MQKLRQIFESKKLSWSQMDQKCPIRREMAKENLVVFGDSGSTAAVFLNTCEICPKRKLLGTFSYNWSKVNTKPSNHGLHESCRTPLPPPLILRVY